MTTVKLDSFIESIKFYLIQIDMSKVEITIRYAILKRNQETFGKMENYVKLKVNNGSGTQTEFKTKVLDGGDKEKPITWNETFTASLQPGRGAQIEFLVMDEDMKTDDLCGRGWFRLDSCGVFNYGASQNYNIRLTGDKEEDEGSLHITTRFV